MKDRTERGNNAVGAKSEPENKQKINVSGRIRNDNPYYLKIADRYRAAGFLLLVLFAVFAVIMLLKFGSNITYDNLVYLARDFKVAMGTSAESVSSVSYTSQENMAFAYFRDGVTVAGSSDVTLYGSSGEEVYSFSENYGYPVLSSSDKYMLVYSPGGKNYSLYNSVTRVLSKETAGEIIAADVSDSGAYVTVVSASSGKYDVEIFGDNLKRIMTVHKDKHVTDAAISPDGEFIAITSVVEGNIDFSSEVYVVRAGDVEPTARITSPSSVPYVADFTKDGTLFVIFDDKIVFYGDGFEPALSFDFEGLSPSCFGAAAGGVTVACRQNTLGTRTKVFSFDTEGKIIYNDTVPARVMEVAAPAESGDCAGYVKTGGEIIMLSVSGDNKSETYSGEVIRMIDTGSGLLVCTGSRAYKLFSASEE